MSKVYRRLRPRPGVMGFFQDALAPRYEEREALRGISFYVERGEAVAYLGPNGAGKSTTLKILAGIFPPSAGQVSVAGLNPTRDRLRHVRNIGVVFGHRSQLWLDLPVRQSFRVLGDIYQVPGPRFAQNLDEFTELLELEPLLEVPARQLSLGQRVRCDLAAALLHSPEILFLDEPTLGLDVSVRTRVRSFLRRINQERQTTILLTSHDLGDIEKLCRRTMVVSDGRLIYDGPLDALKQRSSRAGARVTLELSEPWPSAASDLRHRVDAAALRQVEAPLPHRLVLHLGPEKGHLSEVLRVAFAELPVQDVKVEETQLEDVIQDIFERRLQPEPAAPDPRSAHAP